MTGYLPAAAGKRLALHPVCEARVGLRYCRGLATRAKLIYPGMDIRAAAWRAVRDDHFVDPDAVFASTAPRALPDYR